jgi:alpha-tubulin suppressor-like RCC1 family protein
MYSGGEIMKKKRVIRRIAVILLIMIFTFTNVTVDFGALFYKSNKSAFVKFGLDTYADTTTDISNIPIATGDNHTIAVVSDGTIRSWGYNRNGQLGNGNTNNLYIPTAISNITGVKQFAAGNCYVLAIMNDGTVKAWGLNNYGQLGLGDTTERHTPTTIPNLIGVKQIAANSISSYALMNDGTVKSWGNNDCGQLGNGNQTQTNLTTPTTIPNLTGVIQIFVGNQQAFALMNDGTVRAWGYNANGLLGNGNSNSLLSPTNIPNLSGIKQLVTSSTHSLALLNDGTVKAWGWNLYGQIGIGSASDSTYPPTLVPNLTGVKQIGMGGGCSFALINDGTVKSWGYNGNGQLGNGGATSYTPTLISGLTGVKQLICGSSHTLVMLNNGSLMAWGNNSYGQLGLGDTTQRNVPTLVPGIVFNKNPIISVTSPAPNITTISSIALQGSVSDPDPGNILSVQYNIDNGATQTVSGTVTNSGSFHDTNINVSTLSDGEHTLNVWCTDNFGMNSAIISRIFIKDNSIPIANTPRITVDSNNQLTVIPSPSLSNNSISSTGFDGVTYLYNRDGLDIGTWTSNSLVDTGLKSNTKYTYKYKVGNKVQKAGDYSQLVSVYTKSSVPTLSVATDLISKTTVNVSISDDNPAGTQYLLTCGNKYVNQSGTLLSSQTWITLDRKKIKVTGLQANTSYCFKIKSRNNDGLETQFGNQVQINANAVTLPPPTTITTTPSSISVVVSWSQVSNALGYDLEVDGKIIDNGMKTSYTHKGLSPGVQHVYRVRTRNKYGSGVWSNYITVITGIGLPGSVSMIRTYPTNNSLTLAWDDVSNAERYMVDFNGVQFDNGKNTSFTDYGLQPSTQYSFKVKGVNSSGDGAWSTTGKAITFSLPTPLNVNTTEGIGRIKLAWNTADTADAYEVEVTNQNTSPAAVSITTLSAISLPIQVVNVTTGPGIISTTATAVSYEFTGLIAEAKRTFRVRAKSSLGYSAWSEPIISQVLPSKPEIPSNLMGAADKDSITLSWSRVTGGIAYDVELDGVVIDNDSSLAYIHDGLKPYSVHNYRVRAKNDAIEGDWSNMVCIRTLPDSPMAPENIIIKNTSNNAVITWDGYDDALGYDVEITDGNGVATVVSNICKTTYTHRRASSGIEYTYRLRSRNILGTSPWGGYIVNNSIKAICKRNNDFNLALTASDIVDFSKYNLTVTYNQDVVDVDDLCIQTPEKELIEGKIDGTDITIKSFTPGKITFVVDKVINPGESWTGVVNSIKFIAKVSGGTNITYTVISKPEDN